MELNSQRCLKRFGPGKSLELVHYVCHQHLSLLRKVYNSLRYWASIVARFKQYIYLKFTVVAMGMHGSNLENLVGTWPCLLPHWIHHLWDQWLSTVKAPMPAHCSEKQGSSYGWFGAVLETSLNSCSLTLPLLNPSFLSHFPGVRSASQSVGSPCFLLLSPLYPP